MNVLKTIKKHNKIIWEKKKIFSFHQKFKKNHNLFYFLHFFKVSFIMCLENRLLKWTQRGGRNSILGGIQKPAGHGPEQPVLGDPAWAEG